MEMILAWVGLNWINIAIVILAIGIMGYLWVNGQKANVALYMLTLIGKAEIFFEHGENAAKLQSVIDGLYSKFPRVIKFFYSEDELIQMVKDMVEDTKEWLQNQSK